MRVLPGSRSASPRSGGWRRGAGAALALAASLLLTAAQAAAAAPAAPAGLTQARPPVEHRLTLSPRGGVVLSHLPRPHRRHGGGRAPAFLPRNPKNFGRFKSGKGLPPAVPLQVTSPLVAGAVYGSGGGSSTSTPGSGTADALMSLQQQVGLLGSSQDLVPPDTQVAAGPTDLMEVDNATGSVWTKSGSLVSSFALNDFFGVPSQDAGMGAFDPHVLYDVASGRWFVSASATDPTNTYNQVFLAVSQTSDPTGAWTVYTLESNSWGTLYDQPMLGVSGDKVVLSWNDFDYGYFGGQETWVLEKAQVLAGAAAAAVDFGPDAMRFRLVPALDNGTNTAYLVYNNSDPYNLMQNTTYPSLGVVAINGSPAQGDVSWSEWDPAIAPTSVPPNAAQPGAGPAITTDDDRLLSAVWQNGVLWTAGNDACAPGGGATQSCLRLIEVATTGSPAILQDFDAGIAGTDLYYPAVGLDGAGNLFVAFSMSSPSQYASVAAVVQPAGAAPGALGPLQLVEQGQGVYCGFDCSDGSGTNRWGDYSAVSVDPSNTSQVWVAGEYAASNTDQGNWGTAAAALSAATAG